MAKKKAAQEEAPSEIVDAFIGGEDDDLMDMQYIQDETTSTRVETHPPETKEEAEARLEQEETTDDESDQEESAEKESVEEEAVAVEEEVVAEEAESDRKIPYDRFDTVNKQRKEALEEIERLKKQIETATTPVVEEPEVEPFDYVAKEKEAMDALLEGDSDKYAEIRSEIRQADKVETLTEAKKLASEGDSLIRENMSFEEVGAKIEAEYPQFTEASGEQFNPDAYNELMDLYVGYAKSGRYTRVDALQKAAEKAVKIYGLQPAGSTPAETPDNVVSIKGPDVKQKAAVAKSQPPVMSSVAAGESEPTVDVKSMSDEEYQMLPESTRRRLRGDII
jgi:hypothetical protein